MIFANQTAVATVQQPPDRRAGRLAPTERGGYSVGGGYSVRGGYSVGGGSSMAVQPCRSFGFNQP